MSSLRPSPRGCPGPATAAIASRANSGNSSTVTSGKNRSPARSGLIRKTSRIRKLINDELQVSDDDDDDNDDKKNGPVDSIALFTRNKILGKVISDEERVEIFEDLSESLKHARSNDFRVLFLSLVGDLVIDLETHLGLRLFRATGEQLVLALGSPNLPVQTAAESVLVLCLKHIPDTEFVLKAVIHFGLENGDQDVVKEILHVFPSLLSKIELNRLSDDHLFLVINALANKLLFQASSLSAFMSLQEVAHVVGLESFHSHVNQLSLDQRLAFQEQQKKHRISFNMGNGVTTPTHPNDSGKSGWIEYGAIDDAIIEKLKDDEDPKRRLEGAQELNCALKTMPDFTVLLPQLRLFLNFLDSTLDEPSFQMNLLILEVYGILIDRLRSRVRPHLRTLSASLLKHCHHPKIVVRIENYRVLQKLMTASARPNDVLDHVLEHIGDKRSIVRESVVSVVLFGLLTFPSYEFDLKSIAASIVPSLVDPKRRVRLAALEAVALLAAFLGPTKATPLMKSVELLENHFDKGSGVLDAVQTRLARRQLPRICPEGLVEYSLAVPAHGNGNPALGADVNWVLAGSGSVTSGSAKSVSTQRSDSRLDDSFSGSSPSSFPGSPQEEQQQQPKNGKGPPKELKPLSGKGISHQLRKAVAHLECGPTAVPETAVHSKTKKNKQKQKQNQTGLDLSDFKQAIKECTVSHDELPRLPGTKSQASTASSSATRDSGISLPENKATAAPAASGSIGSRSRSRSTARRSSRANKGSNLGNNPHSKISIDDLPVNGKALSLANRRKSTSTRSHLSESQSLNRLQNKYQYRQSHHNDEMFLMLDNEKDSEKTQDLNDMPRNDDAILSDITPPRSPKYPSAQSQDAKRMISGPAESNPYSSSGQTISKYSQISTPFSANSLPSSSYDYEDDFISTDEEAESDVSVLINNGMSNKSAQSHRTVASTTSTGTMSRIPIKRNSSLRRKKSVMENYVNLNGPLDAKSSQNISSDKTSETFPTRTGLTRPSRSPSRIRERLPDPKAKSLERPTVLKRARQSNRLPLNETLPRKKASKSTGALSAIGDDEMTVFKTSNRIERSPMTQRRELQLMEDDTKLFNLTSASSSSEEPTTVITAVATLPKVATHPDIQNKVPRAEEKPVSAEIGRTSSVRMATAESVVSVGNYDHLSLRTKVTLKSPFEGFNLGPAPTSPPEFLSKCFDDMNHEDWETNVKGMIGIVRLARHHSNYLLVEYKPMIALIMKHVKNLRSQVSRVAVLAIAELFMYLKKSMETELEKIVHPLILKTGDTNKFLREDCHVALDAMADNVSPSKAIAVLVPEDILGHKNPTIRATVSRVLALVCLEKVGINRLQKEFGSQAWPAIARLAQDGSQEARNFAKLTLSKLLEQEPHNYDQILRRHLTPNTLRSMDKILDTLKNSNRRSTNGIRNSSIRLSSRKKRNS